MRIKLLLLSVLLCWQNISFATDLIEVYQQALISDPTYQQAIAQRFSTREGVPISLSALLPNIQLAAVPSLTRTGFAGTYYQSTVGDSANFLSPRNNTQRAYTLTLPMFKVKSLQPKGQTPH
jgi:outer membrane protein